MLHDEKLYHLILQRFNGRMSSSLYGYLHEYSKMYLAHGGWSLEGTKQWTDALEALQKAEHAHARSLLLRQDRRTMEIGSAVLFLRGFERLLELVGTLPRKEETPKEWFGRLLDMVGPPGVFKWTLLSSGMWRATSTRPIKLRDGTYEVVHLVYHPKLMVYTSKGELTLPDERPTFDFSKKSAKESFQELRAFLLLHLGVPLDPHPFFEAKEGELWRLLDGGTGVELWELLWEEYRVVTTAWADSLHVLVRSKDGTQFKTWGTKVSSDYKTRRRLFDEMRAWLRERKDSTQTIPMHPVHESGC